MREGGSVSVPDLWELLVVVVVLIGCSADAFIIYVFSGVGFTIFEPVVIVIPCIFCYEFGVVLCVVDLHGGDVVLLWVL